MTATSETSLAAAVVRYLAPDWTVYQEVQVEGRRADIVGVQGRKRLVVECKTHLSAALVRQAQWWTGKVRSVYVAVPASCVAFAERADQDGVVRSLDVAGIGILSVSDESSVVEVLSLRIDTRARPEWVDGYLHPRHRSERAGRPGGGGVGVRSELLEQLSAYVATVDHGCCTLEEAIAACDAGDRSGWTYRQALRAARDGRVPGVRASKRVGLWWLERALREAR